MSEENTEGRKQKWVSPEPSKPQWFLCWHMLDQLEGLFQPDLLVSSVHQSLWQLDRNIFLNLKLTHKVSFWLSGNEGKQWVGKPIGKNPYDENYVNQANRAHHLLGLENHIKYFTDGRGSLDSRGQSEAWGDPDGSLQMPNVGDAGSIHNVDHLLFMAEG